MQFRNMWKAEATVTKFQVGYMNVLVGLYFVLNIVIKQKVYPKT